MRHGKKFNHLSRKSGHRKALLRNLATALVKYKRIKTTIAKAKELRKFIEPLLTKSKNNTTHSRRTVFSYFQNKNVVNEIFNVISPAIANRPGGYVRIVRLGFRPSDAAEIAMIELVDFNTLAIQSTESENDKKRTRRGKKKKSDELTQVDSNDTKKVEEPLVQTNEDTSDNTNDSAEAIVADNSDESDKSE